MTAYPSLRAVIAGAVGGRSSELEEEVASGLQQYFDKALGQMLLYATERPQFEEQVPMRSVLLQCHSACIPGLALCAC